MTEPQLLIDFFFGMLGAGVLGGLIGALVAVTLIRRRKQHDLADEATEYLKRCAGKHGRR